ncbi:MAG: transposase [Succinivibrionaceae bacterium]|nr:transposase [Succinivibrionaceae bacterium]
MQYAVQKTHRTFFSQYHLSNAAVEATNRKINLSIYMAYGFRNMDNMLDMIMLRCSDIEVRLPWVMILFQLWSYV